MVNSGLPLMKPLVPSRGSTRKKGPVMVGDAAGRHLLLGDDRNPRRDSRQPRQDDFLRLPVGGRDGAVIGLALNLHAGAEVGHLDPCCSQRHTQEAFGEVADFACLHGPSPRDSRASPEGRPQTSTLHAHVVTQKQ